MVHLNINKDYDSCPGTSRMSLIVCDWIYSVIIKTMMKPGPWTIITYSTYVLITWTQAMWHSLYGMGCNSEPLAMICLVFHRLHQYWYHLSRAVGKQLLAFEYVLNLPASIWRQQAHHWLHCIGRVCGQRGLEGMSIARKQMILSRYHLS